MLGAIDDMLNFFLRVRHGGAIFPFRNHTNSLTFFIEHWSDQHAHVPRADLNIRGRA